MKKTLLALSLCAVSFTGFALAEDVSYTLPNDPIWTAADAGQTIYLENDEQTAFTISMKLNAEKVQTLFGLQSGSLDIFTVKAGKDSFTLLQNVVNTSAMEEKENGKWDIVTTTNNGLYIDLDGDTTIKNDLAKNEDLGSVFNNKPANVADATTLTGAALTVSVSDTGDLKITGKFVWGAGDDAPVKEFSINAKADELGSLTEIALNADIVEEAYVEVGALGKEQAYAYNQQIAGPFPPASEPEEPDTPAQPDTPNVPEPTTTTLGLMALAALAARRRRR